MIDINEYEAGAVLTLQNRKPADFSSYLMMELLFKRFFNNLLNKVICRIA